MRKVKRKMVKPVVSVLMPVGKNQNFLDQAVESVNSQTFTDFELLIGEDDGRGITKVLIELAKKAKGKFLARMDADDINEQDRIEKQVDFLISHPDVMLVGTWATLIDERGKKIGLQKMPVSWEEIRKQAFFRNPLIHPSWMMRKSWFEKVGGYNPSFLAAQDWEFLLRRVWRERIENIPEPLIKLRIHSGSVSFSNNRLQVYSGLKARLSAILRGDVRWYKVIYLIPSLLALIIPSKVKLFFRKYFIIECRSATSNEKMLGLVMPIGQNKQQLLKSGQWSLWQSEIEEYQKHFDGVEIFEYKHQDWRRFPEAMLLPFVQPTRFKRCSVLKAVHLSAAITCLVAKAVYQTPYVLSFGYRYDEFALIEKKWFQWILIKIFTSLAVKTADLIIVPTQELKAYVGKLGARQVEVIPNGVDVSLFKPIKKSRFTVHGSRFTVLFVGRLERQKNLESLIKAVYKLLINKLLFVGAGSLKDELVELTDKLGVNLEIIGPISNEKLPSIYHQADIFVLPSLAEGHPKVLLEAMSCGIPCLASTIPGVTDIITHGRDGWLVESTVMGITQGLDHLIKDRKLRLRLGTEARKTVEARFDKKKLMEEECRLLRDFVIK